MAQASRDENNVPTLLGASSVDGITPVRVYADPTTHRLLVDSASGTGNVVGPASSTDNAAVRFDGTTGKLIQNSGVIIDDSNNVTGITALTATGALKSTLSVILEDPGAGTNTITLQAPTLAGSYTLTLPVDDGTPSQFLQTDGAGVLSWQTVSAGAGGSNTQVQYNNAGALGGISGATTNGTALTFASAALILAGAGSGTTVLNASSTASGTLTLPAATDTLVGKATTDAFTNKTFNTAATGNVFQINGTGITAVNGTGAVSLTTNAVFVTPTLGVATATSINGLAITTSTGTLTITNLKTLTVSNTLTFTGTDGSSVAFGTGGTVLYTTSTIPLTVGTSTIASGTTTRILYDNAGVLGEYTITGSGTVVAMQTAPTFITSITTPKIIGGSGTTGTQLTFQTTTGVGTTDQYVFNGGNAGATTFLTLAANVANFGTSAVATVGTIELGAATDTTLSRSAAGVLAVEGVVIPSISSTNTLTNKRVTRRNASTAGPGATPSTNTDNVDLQIFTALAANITSMTTNLSGTPATGDFLEYWLTDNGTARTITWGASFAATTVALPTTTVISTKLRVLFEWGGSTWDCVAVA